MEVHPHLACTSILDHYDKLVGLSISRGFISTVRELFGGPRGCTHITALLMAMAPVVVQSLWTVRVASDQVATPRLMTEEERRAAAAVNIGSCHVWAEDGELAATVAVGGQPPIPLWAERRLRERGMDPSTWRPR
jgi:hypothetical protein